MRMADTILSTNCATEMTAWCFIPCIPTRNPTRTIPHHKMSRSVLFNTMSESVKNKTNNPICPIKTMIRRKDGFFCGYRFRKNAPTIMQRINKQNTNEKSIMVNDINLLLLHANFFLM